MIGVIPQALTSDHDLTVEENLSIYAKLYGVPKCAARAQHRRVARSRRPTKWREAQTKTLSGGMRRRLEIARGLVHNPQIFFLDEPTTGLDPVSRIAVWEMLDKLEEHRQLTMLITTHYMEEADSLCDRIAIVDHGKLVALDTPVELKQSVPGLERGRGAVRSRIARWQAALEEAGRGDRSAVAVRRHVSRADFEWLAHHHPAGGDGGMPGRTPHTR